MLARVLQGVIASGFTALCRDVYTTHTLLTDRSVNYFTFNAGEVKYSQGFAGDHDVLIPFQMLPNREHVEISGKRLGGIVQFCASCF